MKKNFIKTIFALSALLTTFSIQAHHSFAIYDIDNKIERTGVLTEFAFRSPHIKIKLEVTNDDGTTETWDIESMAPSRWDSTGQDREFAKVGDTVTLLGWPARNGKDEMALSTIIGENGTMVVRDEINQRRAREDLPEETIKRD